jgi:hypothetical protein
VAVRKGLALARLNVVAAGERSPGARLGALLDDANSRLRAPRFLVDGLVALYAIVLAGFTIKLGYNPHDEGLMLQAGARIVSGEWPYRDFWMNYPPGQALLLAFLQEIFGLTLMAWRVLAVLTNGVIVVLIYRLARRRASDWYAVVAALVVGAVLAYPLLPEPNHSAIALALGSLAAARRRPTLAGFLAGLTVLFRIELGVAAIVAVVLSVPPGRRRRALITAVVVALATLAPFVIAAPGAMWRDTFGFYSAQHLQRLPFPLHYTQGWTHIRNVLAFYGPTFLVVGLALAVATLLVRFRRESWPSGRGLGGWTDAGRELLRRNPEESSLEVWALLPLLFVGLAYLLARTDASHTDQLGAVLPLFAVWLLPGARPRALQVALVVAVGLIGVYGLQFREHALVRYKSGVAVPGPAGGGVETSPTDARALADLRAKLAQLIRPGAPVFVANPRFDLVTVGDPELYTIIGHPNPTRYDVMQPGVVTTAPVQREIIRSLQNSHTHVVIRWLNALADKPQPDGAGRSSGVNILGRYIASHYRPVATYGQYQVLTNITPAQSSGG